MLLQAFRKPEKVIEEASDSSGSFGSLLGCQPPGGGQQERDFGGQDDGAACAAIRFIIWTEKVLKVLFTGYIPAPKEKAPLFYIGMMNTTISGNTLEGVRLRAGGMTTAWLNPHLFGRGYMAYGFRDHRVKGLGRTGIFFS